MQTGTELARLQELLGVNDESQGFGLLQHRNVDLAKVVAVRVVDFNDYGYRAEGDNRDGFSMNCSEKVDELLTLGFQITSVYVGKHEGVNGESHSVHIVLVKLRPDA